MIFLDLRVTRDCVKRACLIMDTLVKALEEREYQLSIEKGNPTATIVIVDGEAIEIGIDEKIRAVDHVLTPKEKGENGGYPYWAPRFDHIPTGELTLKIRNATYLGVRQIWGDGKVQRLEDCIGSFMSGLHRAAHAIKERQLEQERQKQEWEEADRRRKELQRLERIEEKRIEKLSEDVSNWRTAKNIRRYLEQVKKLEVEIKGLDAGIVWANAYAEKIDPLTRPENLMLKIDENRWR